MANPASSAKNQRAGSTQKPASKSKEAVTKPAPKRTATKLVKAAARGKMTSAQPETKKFAADHFFNRELSWLDFNSRVLTLAGSASVPLLERVKFLSIFSSNLDEFYMVRVAGVLEQIRTRTRESAADGHTPEEVLESITKHVRELTAQQSRILTKELIPALGEKGIEVVPRNKLTAADVKFLKKYFFKQVYPVLTPMAVDPAHPFPHLPNKCLALCVLLLNRAVGGNARKPLYAFVEVPSVLPRFVPLKGVRGRSRFILLGDVIALHLPQIFAGSEILSSFTMRVTRDSDLEIDEDEVQDLLKSIEAELRQRQWGNVVRLEISSEAPEHAVTYLREMLEIEKRDVVSITGPLSLADYMALTKLPGHAALRYPPFKPHQRPVWRRSKDMFELIRSGDQLVHHPYESFAPVMDFIDQAASDPQVLAIKMTLYRTSPESPIMRSLIRAANNGKQVVALVELKARFDEANNIQWARQLEREGVHVVYGMVGLKTHCKACLVVRREDKDKQLRRYCHLATGNYNPTTAALYTDLGLFTANPDICEDVSNLFNMLTGFSAHQDWLRIVPAPKELHKRLVAMIAREEATARRGGKARIVCKMNSLVDPEIIEALYRASQAGVKIDLVVRGICCLRPGVPGVSENIRVMSVVGRFLEHTRIFYFEHKDLAEVWLSSGDWMQRNFFSRIEVMFPVEDEGLRKRLVKEVLEVVLADTANSWDLKPDGTWKRRSPAAGAKPVDCQAVLMELENCMER
jgi:polyphosphate kinase